MKPTIVFQEFEQIAEKLGIRIVLEKGDFKGGFCLLEEEHIIVINSMIEEVAIVVGNVDSYLNPIPGEFGLSAAYPNPFNPTTTLGLALDVDGFVSMSVFNIRGQVVEVLVDRNMKAGYHNVVWNADGISSGMYFVRVETGANTAMQKLMLLK